MNCVTTIPQQPRRRFWNKALGGPWWAWLLFVWGFMLLGSYVALWLLSAKADTNAHTRSRIELLQIDLLAKNLSHMTGQADSHAHIAGVFASPNGIRTLKPGEPGEVEVDGKVLDHIASSPELAAFKEHRGKHPWGGCYWFLGLRANGIPKPLFSPTDRLIMEIPGKNNKDGLISVAFADGHIVRFPAPGRPLTVEDVRAILSVQGEESLWGAATPPPDKP